MPRVRSSRRALTLARQSWFLSSGPSLSVTPRADDGRLNRLEDLSLMTWMAIGASTLLFVASLPGGLPTVLFMLVGVGLGVAGLQLRQRARLGPPVEPPRLDVARASLRREAQSRALVREFGPRGGIPAPGRRVEVLKVNALRVVYLFGPGRNLCAVLMDAADEGLVLIRGAVLRLEFEESHAFRRRIRVEVLPRTQGVLSLASYGNEVESLDLDADESVLAWLEACRDLERLHADELPWALAEKLEPNLAPYRA